MEKNLRKDVLDVVALRRMFEDYNVVLAKIKMKGRKNGKVSEVFTSKRMDWKLLE